MNYNVDEKGYYGDWRRFCPEMLYPNVAELRENYLKITAEPSFKKEFDELLKAYVGRPTPVLCQAFIGTIQYKIYLKREDLCHTGAHRSTIPLDKFFWQNVWAKPHYSRNRRRTQSGLQRFGAGHRMYCLHGRARHTTTSTQFAYENARRWSRAAQSGSKTLKDATNEAIRIGSTSCGYPISLVWYRPSPLSRYGSRFQSVVVRTKALQEQEGRDYTITLLLAWGETMPKDFTITLNDERVNIIAEEAGKRIDIGKVLLLP